jgi:hypothetical protein
MPGRECQKDTHKNFWTLFLGVAVDGIFQAKVLVHTGCHSMMQMHLDIGEWFGILSSVRTTLQGLWDVVSVSANKSSMLRPDLMNTDIGASGWGGSHSFRIDGRATRGHVIRFGTVRSVC